MIDAPNQEWLVAKPKHPTWPSPPEVEETEDVLSLIHI